MSPLKSWQAELDNQHCMHQHTYRQSSTQVGHTDKHRDYAGDIMEENALGKNDTSFENEISIILTLIGKTLVYLNVNSHG